MKQTYITTHNYSRFHDLCAELASPGLIGPSLALVSGPAGWGKTEAAATYYTQYGTAVVVDALNIRTYVMMLREICFKLVGVRPFKAEACLAVLGEALGRERRLIVIDEADLLEMKVIEMLRNLNERFGAPLILVTEEKSPRKWADRQRLMSRIRRRLEFAPVSRSEVVLAYREWLSTELDPVVAQIFQADSQGSFRRPLTRADEVERALRASALSTVSPTMAKEICGRG